jgi:hypothetical protein
MRFSRHIFGTPAFWGFAYLSLIPNFAAIYAGQDAGSFHDSNIRHEAGRTQDVERLKTALTREISTRLDHWQVEKMKWAIAPKSVKVGQLSIDRRKRLVLQVTGYSHPVGRPNLSEGFSELIAVIPETSSVSASAAGVEYGLPVTLLDTLFVTTFDTPVSPVAPPLRALFPSIGKASLLVLAGEAYELLGHFYAANAGDPAYVPEGWWRMVYLSAVTVTTLGFGDITPVSESARLYVALEAVLGVVFVGVFLSRLAVRVRG